MKIYKDINKDILVSLPNCGKNTYKINIDCEEVTFLGKSEQPDFGFVQIEFYPAEKIIELKSLKLYFYQLRDIVVSYERFINVLYNHLMEVYKPKQLIVKVKFEKRGGISSTLIIDSRENSN